MRTERVQDQVHADQRTGRVQDQVHADQRTGPVQDQVHLEERASTVQDQVHMEQRTSTVQDQVHMEQRTSTVQDQVHMEQRTGSRPEQSREGMVKSEGGARAMESKGFILCRAGSHFESTESKSPPASVRVSAASAYADLQQHRSEGVHRKPSPMSSYVPQPDYLEDDEDSDLIKPKKLPNPLEKQQEKQQEENLKAPEFVKVKKNLRRTSFQSKEEKEV
ncbi:hypothetical protein GBF38_008375 [Nibea albiflora]|uniref:Uncharacterized protein n=1 Tax=Nibea albiflora TaxID=240163 RepID=A0ACB7EZ79_NIBAL|nr:hypothetical protein GBF38_008375 [Nibea albiflora]